MCMYTTGGITLNEIVDFMNDKFKVGVKRVNEENNDKKEKTKLAAVKWKDIKNYYLKIQDWWAEIFSLYYQGSLIYI